MAFSPGASPQAPFSELPLLRKLEVRARFLSGLRRFFTERKFLELETPVRVSCPGIDPYIDALPAGSDRWLATSPELEMKKTLAFGARQIFQLTRAFRADESGPLHHPEFSLLEWYEAGEDYGRTMDITEKLVLDASDLLTGEGILTAARSWPRPFERISVDDAFAAAARWRPSEEFAAKRFFRDLIEKVEPALASKGAVFLCDYPAELGALARLKEGNPEVCERFELYLDGIEICNGFSELTDAGEQRRRFERDNARRLKEGRDAYPVDEAFLDALQSGPSECSGNALGIDRLLLALTGLRNLEDVTLLSSRPFSNPRTSVLVEKRCSLTPGV